MFKFQIKSKSTVINVHLQWKNVFSLIKQDLYGQLLVRVTLPKYLAYIQSKTSTLCQPVTSAHVMW